MFAKFLKRNTSRSSFDLPTNDGGVKGISPSKTAPSLAASTAAAKGLASSNGKDPGKSNQASLPLQYKYQRPDLLGGYTESDFGLFANHTTRPMVQPKSDGNLPDGVGYAETMNAGRPFLN